MHDCECGALGRGVRHRLYLRREFFLALSDKTEPGGEECTEDQRMGQFCPAQSANRN